MLLVIAATSGCSPGSHTACFALFESPAAAERAVADAENMGFDDVDVDERGKTAVTFNADETGEDAEELVAGFRRFVREAGGKLGHPDPGCLEKSIGD